MAANSKANVSTTRGHKGGYLFSAPVGTAGAPTSSTYKAATWLTSGNPPAGWECLGYIPEDGFTESASRDSSTTLRDINLENLDEVSGTVTETMRVALMEVKKHTLGTIFGHANVTDANGVIEVQHNWAQADEHYQFVFLLLLKNDREWTKYIPDAKVTEIGDFTGNKTTAAQREVTLTYLTDDSGSGCYDWYDSTETPAPTLTALSGVTLSPSFSANARSYTATATGTSVTLTATAAAGNTVSIKDGNGNTYSSGNSIPIVTGRNVITVYVTNTASSAVGTYVVTITKS